ncbi:MAG: hypothetical protein RL426_804, partial [Pseudomonadota bacterium]
VEIDSKFTDFILNKMKNIVHG